MKKVNIQIQPERNDSLNEDLVAESLTRIGIKPIITEGDDKGRYINYDFETDNIQETWKQIKEHILSIENIAKTSIICCEGNNGWDDYLLLHHYDGAIKLDAV